jgi:hypothetical protein
MDGAARLGDAWTWPKFLDGLVDGFIDPIAAAAENSAGQPLVISVDAAYVPVPDPGGADVHSLAFPRDVVVFHLSGGSLTSSEARCDADLLTSLRGATTLRDLGQRIRRLPDLERIWVDFAAGLRFRPGRDHSAQGDIDVWDGPVLWARAVEPWTAWIR